MRFFVPGAASSEVALKAWEAFRQFARDTLGWPVTERKIFSIRYRHNDEEHRAEVGWIFKPTREAVLAILESDAYLICTENRGGVRGEPILVGKEEVLSVTDFDVSSPGKKPKPKPMKAWLLTWEGQSERAKQPGNVAAILSARMSPERVQEIAELLYANAEYTLEERAAFARNKKNNPYPARFDHVGGIRWSSRMLIGHNPWVYARVVTELVVHKRDGEEQYLTWVEPSREEIEKVVSALGLGNVPRLDE